jgi:hypothetical protein
MMKMAVRVSVQDEQGRDVANREHIVSGSSRFDFQGARQTAVKNLATAMRKAGPMAALGFAE